MSSEATRTLTSIEPDDALPGRIADRYDIECLLGRGGMAVAYRAYDAVTGHKVALKLLSSSPSPERAARDLDLFEREYQTLVQLAHPRVVQAFEYGVHGDAPYYTMELLDGGDLQTLSPMPWQEAVAAAYEICSALSMLHSRGLVHRDLTPRNIRRTSDGKAKLLDFGLLSPMGPPELLAGTPPFVPPELVNWVSLDGRSDLFSLGATLYFVLTGRHAFPAKRLDHLRDVWRTSPRAPSKLVADIPAAVDAVVLAMLRIDSGSRPKSAAEVMERLLPLLPRVPDDELRVASAHLTAPRLVGRTSIIDAFRKRVLRATRRRGGGFLVQGEAGTGRSRMLDAFVLEAKLAGATTVRAGASNAGTAFGVAAALAARLHAASPSSSVAAARRDPGVLATLFRSAREPRSDVVEYDLVDLTSDAFDRGVLYGALRAWLLELTKVRPIAIAVDDFDQIDEPSAALLASLTSQAKKHALVYAFAVDAASVRSPSTALHILQDNAELAVLEPLDAAQTTELLASIFGDTANLQLLSRRLHHLCGGRPRDCISLAQHLVDRGVITYGGGSFTLPGEIAEGMLPASVEESLSGQIARLRPVARKAAGLVALEITDRMSRAQLMRALGVSAAVVDAAVDELVAQRVMAGDASGYQLRDGTLRRLVAASFTENERKDMHRTLAELDQRSVSSPVAVAYHKLQGHRPEDGLDYLLPLIRETEARVRIATESLESLGGERAAAALRTAVAVAEKAKRPRRDLQSLWVMLAGAGAAGEDASCFYDVPDAWLEQLKRDSGWYDWQGLDPSLEPPARAMMAVGAAVQRFASLPEEERVLAPPDAIRQLVSYVVFAIGVAARVYDLSLQSSLPELLQPFAPLDPTVRAMLANARGTWLNGQGKREAARELFEGVIREIDALTDAPGYLHKVRAAIAQTLAEIDASLGVTSAFTERLDDEALDPHQRVGARYIQKVAALHQGNWEAAERYRQLAELEMLQSRSRPMFSTLGQELEAHAMARDLTGLRQVRAAIHKMAEKHQGWAPVVRVADAHYQRLCGELEAALSTARSARTLRDCAILSPWVFHAAAVETELLVELGRPSEAVEAAQSTLSECEREGMRCFARSLSLALALAEAKLGDFSAATDRLDRVVAEQKDLGITGLSLGRSYEHRARVAIWSADIGAFERFAKLAAEQYRPGESSVLGALHERLMEEARQAGIGVEGQIHYGRAEARSVTNTTGWDEVTAALSVCADRRERGERALSLLLQGNPPKRGHLFFVGPRGLELVASSEPPKDVKALARFAQDRLDAELDPSETVTGILDTASTPSIELTWHSTDGSVFTTVLLATPDGDSVLITGVLVLADEGQRRRHFDEVVAAVARTSLASGDARGVRPN